MANPAARIPGTCAFDERLGQLYQAGDAATEALIEGIGDQVDLDSLMSEMPRIEDLLESDDEAPVIRLINGLFGQALRLRASDIHIETFEQSLVVRLRVDGHLREVLRRRVRCRPCWCRGSRSWPAWTSPKSASPRTAASPARGGREVDVRVSTLPGIHGERVVMRVLDKQASLLALDNLGMPAAVLQGLRSCLARPNGIVLSTGPTGSGKTTTLYASLNSLNDGSRNILTVEDPVEYAIAGIGQTAINPRRADLCQWPARHPAPGPGRDHARRNPRSGDRADRRAGQPHRPPGAVDPAHQQRGGRGDPPARHGHRAVPDRLVPARRAGPAPGAAPVQLCGGAAAASRRARLWPELAALDSSYHPVGCEQCQGSGYIGRLGLYEFIELDAGLIGLLYDGASELAMQDYLAERRQSLVAMASDCLARGETSLAEVLRVVQG
jgi:general secretion pathway protein E